MVAHTWIDTDAAFASLVEELKQQPRIGLDTEFHRERTYFPDVALVQIGWAGGIALVDTLKVDLRPLAPVLQSDTVLVMHAGSQDLEVLRRSCEALPTTLFDTQIAAGFVGLASASLAALCKRFVGVELAKGDRLTDWKRRPLSDDAKSYAAADVVYLFDLHDTLSADLERRGRTAWAADECAALVVRSQQLPPLSQAWWRVKEARKLRGRAAAIAQEVAAWRDERARRLDRPVRFVFPDLGVVAVAQRPPSRLEDVRRVRGLDDRHLRAGGAEELLEAVERGRQLPLSEVDEPEAVIVDADLRPAVALIASWVSQLARDLEIDPAALATRSDIEALVAGRPGPLDEGWRHDTLAVPLRQLLDGEAALAFAGRGRLVLEAKERRGASADYVKLRAIW